jgi:glycosyltransferase involved in cell wall biosynthesis
LSQFNCLVSILIPVYNRDLIIAETIQSALDQTYKNIEVVIVDNASIDNSWEVIQSFSKKDSRIKAFRNKTNIGPVRNWLRCVEEAAGEYGKILWSDDLVAPNYIEKTLPLFNKDVGFVYSGANIFTNNNPLEGETSYLLPKTGHFLSSMYIKKAIFDKGVPVSPGCAIFRMYDIRKNLWLNVPNKVNSDFSMHAIGNDLLLFLLTARDYKYFGHIAEPLTFFRVHKGSISINSKGGKLSLHYSLVKAYFVEYYLPNAVSQLAAKIKILLWRFKDAKQFGMNSVDDFFIKKVNTNYFFLAIFLIKIVFNRIKITKLSQ